jgi:hypothetical protein
MDNGALRSFGHYLHHQMSSRKKAVMLELVPSYIALHIVYGRFVRNAYPDFESKAGT